MCGQSEGAGVGTGHGYYTIHRAPIPSIQPTTQSLSFVAIATVHHPIFPCGRDITPHPTSCHMEQSCRDLHRFRALPHTGGSAVLYKHPTIGSYLFADAGPAPVVGTLIIYVGYIPSFHPWPSQRDHLVFVVCRCIGLSVARMLHFRLSFVYIAATISQFGGPVHLDHPVVSPYSA